MNGRGSLRFTLSEGWRNAWAGRAASAVLVALVAATFALVAVADARAVQGLVADERSWVEAGGRVLVAENESGLPVIACDALNRVPGVQGAVAVTRMAYRVGLSSAPEANLGLVGVTPGLSRLLGAPYDAGAVLVAPELAEEYGLRDRARTALIPRSLATQEGPSARVEGSVLPDDSLYSIRLAPLALLGDAYSSSVLIPMPTSGTADACFVAAEPGSLAALREALPALLPAGGDKPTVVGDRLISGSFVHDYPAEYLARALRWAPVAAGLLIGLIWLLFRWVRRAQDGLYSTLGFRAGHRAVIQLAEWATLLAAGVALAATVAILVLVAGRDWTMVTAIHVLRDLTMASAAATAVAVLVPLLPLRSPLAALKDH